jgi:hypothetical protein
MSDNVLLAEIQDDNGPKLDGWEEHPKRERGIARPVHVRVLDQAGEETATTLNINGDGLWFTSSRDRYNVGMPLFVSLPNSAGSVRYLGEVVSVEVLPNGSRAVAVRFAPNCNAQ